MSTVHQPLRLGIIADDVTGATDVAGYLVREGTPTVQFFGVPASDAVLPEGTECVVIALKTRSVAPGLAVEQSLAAYAWLRDRGVEHTYIKYCSTFDSTPSGNIGPVIDALAEAAGAGPVVVAPSAPENGRTVYQGKLFVHRQLLEESPLKDHPLNPMRDSDLARLLAPQSSGASGLVDWATVQSGDATVADALCGFADDGVRFAVADALTNADLDVVAGAVLATGAPLSSGSAGLGAALGRTMSGGGRAAVPIGFPDGAALVLSGSCSAATRQQVERYRTAHPSFLIDPLALAADPSIVDRAVAFVAEHLAEAPLVYSSADPERVAEAQEVLGVEGAAALLEDALGTIADRARAHGVTKFVVAGGETSGAVMAALDIDAVRIGPEVAVGVPWCVTLDAQGGTAVVLKSGNFGGADFFDDALEAAR